MNGNNVGLRIVSALVLVAVIAGIAFFAFRAGIAPGSPITIQAPSGQSQTAPAPYPYYGYGYGMPFHPWGPWGFGFGCFGPLLAFFLIFLAFRAFGFLFWGRHWGWGRRGMYGPWRHGWGEGGVPPMFEEWHKRAHNPSAGSEPTEEGKES
jgi:hypothetical protein